MRKGFKGEDRMRRTPNLIYKNHLVYIRRSWVVLGTVDADGLLCTTGKWLKAASEVLLKLVNLGE